MNLGIRTNSRDVLAAPLAAIALSAAALLAFAAPAEATTFCVPDFHSACRDNGTNVAESDLPDALSINGADGQADRVVIDEGTFTQTGPLSVAGSDLLTITGAGRNATILTSSSTGNDFVVNLWGGGANTREVTIRDLQIRIPASAPDGGGAGIQLSGDTLERVDIVSRNKLGSGLTSWVGGGTYRVGSIRSQGGGSLETAIGSGSFSSDVMTVERVAIQGSNSGIYNATATAEIRVSRSSVVDAVQAAAAVSAGKLTLRDTQISGLQSGAFIMAQANTSNDASLTADHVTISGDGTGSSVGVSVGVAAGQIGDAEVNLSNSIVHGKPFSYLCQAPIGAGTGNALVDSTYSNIDLTTGVEAGDCSVSSTGNIAENPDFRADDDLRLRPGSPSIDAGNPLGIFAGLDLLGLPRVTDGDGDGDEVTDQGAFEFDRIRPRTTIDTGPGSGVHRGVAKFSFHSNEPVGDFRCKIDRKTYKRCFGTKRFKNLSPGRHTFRVYAVDGYGNRDRSPAVKRFRVPA